MNAVAARPARFPFAALSSAVLNNSKLTSSETAVCAFWLLLADARVRTQRAGSLGAREEAPRDTTTREAVDIMALIGSFL